MDPAEHAHRSLLRAFGSLKQVMKPHFARYGISGPQWAVLRNLCRAELEGEKGLRLRDLADRLLIRPPSVTGVVDRLEREGLVSRSRARDDRRVRRVRLTPAGRALHERVRAIHTERIQAMMSGLSRREQARLGRLLDRLEAHLRPMRVE